MPPTKIVIRSDLFDGGANYNRASQLLQQYYENSPTSLRNIPISEKELGDLAYYATLAEQSAKTSAPNKHGVA